MSNIKEMKKWTFKDALLPVYALRNVDILYPKKILDRLMSLSDVDLGVVWNQRNGTEEMSPNDIYNGLVNYANEIKNGTTEHEGVDMLKKVLQIKELEVFKKTNRENEKETRKYGYRSVYVNWAISKFLLEKKSHFWKKSTEFRCRVQKLTKNDQFIKTLSKNDEIHSYGYLPSINEVNGYLGLTGSQALDETKPYLYFNWSWAYRKYVNASIKSNKLKALHKIDLSGAFTNFSYDTVSKFTKGDWLYDTLAFINGFNQNHNDGVKYGFLIESYFLSSYSLTIFKYQFIDFLKEDGYETKVMLSYVDDNYISIVKNGKPVGEDEFDEIQEKWNATHEFEFNLNPGKTEFYQVGSEARLIADASVSGGHQFSNYFIGEGDDIIENALISRRQKMKIKAMKVADSYMDDNSSFNWSEEKVSILKNKYVSSFLKRVINKSPIQNVSFFFEELRASFEDDSESLKVADALILAKFEDRTKQRMVDNFIDSLIQNVGQSDGEYENQLYVHLNRYPKLLKTTAKKGKLIKSKSLDEIILTLLQISIKISKLPKNSASIKHGEFSEEAILFSAKETKLDELTLTTLLSSFKIWIDEKHSPSDWEIEIDDESYLAAFKREIFNLLLFEDEQTILEQRIKMAFVGVTSRKEAAQNLIRLTDHIYRYEIQMKNFEKGTIANIKYKPSLWSKVDGNFDKISRKIYNAVKNAKDSIRTNKAQFAKWDIIVLLRNFVSMSWANGSRELEHYSNHSLLHCDKLVESYDDLFGKFYSGAMFITPNKEDVGKYNNDPFIVILSIYIHDIGLLDDDIFFGKHSFLSGVINSSKQSIKEWYIELRHKMTEAARDSHGETSASIAFEIYSKLNVSKNDIKRETFHKALQAALLHNASSSHYLGVPLLNEAEFFLVSLLDLTDSGWDRIGRPYVNIGTSSASNDDKMWWLKDLIVESVTKVTKLSSKTPVVSIVINYVDEFLDRIAQNFVDTIRVAGTFEEFFGEKYIADKKIDLGNVKEFIKKYVMDKMFKTEMFYLSDKKRKNNGIYLWRDKIGVNVEITFKSVETKRGIEYRTVKSDVPWIDEFSTDFAYIKSFMGIKD